MKLIQQVIACSHSFQTIKKFTVRNECQKTAEKEFVNKVDTTANNENIQDENECGKENINDEESTHLSE